MAVGNESIPADLAAVHQSAAQAFATAVNEATSGSGAPAPAEPAAPPAPAGGDPSAAPAPAAPAAAAPAAAPQPSEPPSAPQPAPAAAPPSGGIDVSSWSPESRRFLEMAGWDGKAAVTPELFQASLARGLEYNNRLGKNGGAPADPAAPKPATPAAPTAPPADPVEQVQAQIAQAQDTDPECSQLVAEYSQLEPMLKELGDENSGKIGEARVAVERLKWYLDQPDIKDNPLRTDEVNREIQRLSFDLSRLRAERSIGLAQMDRVEQRWQRRADLIDSHIRGDIRRTAAINRRADELHGQWPALVQAAADGAAIPKESQAEFFEDLKNHFVLTQRAGIDIPDLGAFMKGFAERRAKQLDAYHRQKAAEYGTRAHERTETVTPGTPNVPGPPSATPATSQPNSLSDFYGEHEKNRYAAMPR